MTPPHPRPHEQKRRQSAIRRHVSAARAFHTDLIAETYRHLYVLRRMASHIDLMRQPNHRASDKLTAARASFRELRALEQLKRPWRELYRDFRYHLGRAHALLRQIARTPE